MELLHEIDPDLLQKAADIAINRYPNLRVRLRRGVFWNFLEKNDRPLRIQPETAWPCAPLDSRAEDGYFLRILYYRCTISVEMFHALTDGTGAMEFLKTVVYHYLTLVGKTIPDQGMILQGDDLPDRHEQEDSFTRYYRPEKRPQPKEPKAFLLEGTHFEPAGCNVLSGEMQAEKIHAAAKRRNVTITAYLTAALILSIRDSCMDFGYLAPRRPVTVSVPVNLRTLFPSRTMRNFFAVANVCVPLKEEMGFEEILEKVCTELSEKTSRSHLERQIMQNVRLERNLAVKFVPLFLKKMILREAFLLRGENCKTITISNLGRVRLPEEMAAETACASLTLYPTEKSPVNCGVCTLGDSLIMTFNRTIMESDLIRRFFRFVMEDAGTQVKIRTNNWGYPHETM